MTKVSEELARALESDDACEIGRLIEEGKQEDFEALHSLLSLEPQRSQGKLDSINSIVKIALMPV